MPFYKAHPDYQPSAEWLENPKFHHPDKGCQVWFTGIRKCPRLTRAHSSCETCETVSRGKCTTHRVIVCHGEEKGTICGWEFRSHFSDIAE